MKSRPAETTSETARLLPLRSPEQLLARQPSGVDAATLTAVGAIVEDVRRRGAPAVRAHAERLGDLLPGAPLCIERPELEAVLASLPAEQRALLERTAARIVAFARAQLACLRPLDLAIAGGRAGHDLLPLDSAGCYAPGGRFPLPSTVLMTAMVAKVAGVGRVVVASPRPTPLVLAAAALAGAERVLAVGGAQAIAALAYGTQGTTDAERNPTPLPPNERLLPVDLICGPGNRFVTAAKQLVFGQVGIEGLAGPSELVVIADRSADPQLVAADLLAQAEHDPDAWPILISTDAELIAAVRAELVAQLRGASQAASTTPEAVAWLSLSAGGAVLVPDLESAAALSDRLAPEHLALFVAEPRALAARLRHAGGLFLGQSSSEVFGDYGLGPNHVLPTGFSARRRAGLSVFDFLRARTWMELRPGPELSAAAADARALAELEGLRFHAQAASRRLS